MAKWSSVEIQEEVATLRRYARALTRDPHAADDLVQGTLLRALERADSYDPLRPLQAWLLSILHNLFVSDRRRVAGEGRGLDRIADEMPFPVEVDPEESAYLAQIEARVAALPEQQRAVLHLVVAEGMSYQEAAVALSLPIGTVMSRLSRARAALREKAGERKHGEPGLRIVGGRDA